MRDGRIQLLSLLAIGVLCAPIPADPSTPNNEIEEQLVLYPDELQLENHNDASRVIVILRRRDGLTEDVTRQADYIFDPSGVAAWRAERVEPLADGRTKLTVCFQNLTAEIPVVVRGSTELRPVSFRHDVQPVLMKAGCNSGACHGNARGQEGFRLSLFGYDPQMDFTHLTRQLQGRRIDLASPSNSLMLQKPLNRISHEGGKRFEQGSVLHQLLKRWIEAAAPPDPPDLPELCGVQLFPQQCVMTTGSRQQLVVQADYASGMDRDVTELAVFSSLDDAVVEVDPHGGVLAMGTGEAFVMARFGVFAVVSQIIVVDDANFEWDRRIQPRNYIDEAIHAKLRKLRILPSAMCSDEVFLRRVFLDIIGLLPTREEYERFMNDARADKRTRLIDRLLERPEFPELWAMKWAELLRIESEKLTQKGVELYSAWLRDALQNDMPVDEMVRALLTAEGGNFHNPAANFFLVEQQPNLVAEDVSQVFMGVRIQCAQCHNHPFERWTQDDYYSFAAFFAQIGRKASEDPRETMIYNSRQGDVKHPRNGQIMKPRFLGGAAPEIKPGQDRRRVLARWLTAQGNPWFAKNIVNRVWAHFMGGGIIDPADDVRVSNPPSHPGLLDTLADRFVQSGYDMRALVRDICNSRTYQHTTEVNESNAEDRRNFSVARLRRLPAEQLLDAICQVTGSAEKFAGLPLGARAVQIADARSGSFFLKTFGRPSRESACTCARRNEPTLSQALHLINGDTLWRKIRDNPRISGWIARKVPIEEIVNRLYVSALCRPPDDRELRRAVKHVSESESEMAGLEDLLWALLNSQEFIFNH